MTLLLFCLSFLGVPGKKFPLAEVIPVVRCAVGEAQLSQPAHITLDEKGQVYGLDRASRVIYQWDAQGSYTGSFGGHGLGPGEISLEDGVGCMAVTSEAIWVFDTRIQKVHQWTRDRVFVGSKPLPAALGRVRDAVAYGNQIVIYTSLSNPVAQQLVLLSPDLEPLRVLAEVNDSEYRRNAEGGWLYRPFADRLVYAFGRSELWYGNSNQNWAMMAALGPKAKLKHKQLFPLVGAAVTEIDKAQYLENHRKYASDKDRIEFSKDHPVITFLFSLDDKTLAASQFNFAGESFDGLLIDTGQSKVVGSFTSKLGGSILYLGNAAGRLVYAIEDEKGQCQVVLARFKLGKEARLGKSVLD